MEITSPDTSTNTHISDQVKLHCGVPQGSVLGIFLFLIMVKENYILNENIQHLEDDVTLALAYKPGYGSTLLNDVLDHESQWASVNRIQIIP